MTKPKCRNCTFWVEGEQFGRNKTEDPDDRAGSCHRRAPHPTMGRWEYEVLQHLTLISWNTPNSKEKEEDFKSWEDCELQPCAWPETRAANWCGEFKPKRKPKPKRPKP
jgi:hypothetical protein